MFIATVPYTRITRFRNSLAAALKWSLSFRKQQWNLNDYPICIAKLERESPFRSSRSEQHDYRASIINWAVMGSGSSPEEALHSLQVNFEALQQAKEQEGTVLVRPGSHGKLEFASQVEIEAHAELSEDFTQRILELEWAWISDESSLWDFHGELTNDHLYAKIKEVYGVDVSDIESARLWMIFERIEQSKAHRPELSYGKDGDGAALENAQKRFPLCPQLRRRRIRFVSASASEPRHTP